MERGRGPTGSRAWRLVAPPRPQGTDPELRRPALRFAAPIATTLSLLALALVAHDATGGGPIVAGSLADAAEATTSIAPAAPTAGATGTPTAAAPASTAGATTTAAPTTSPTGAFTDPTVAAAATTAGPTRPAPGTTAVEPAPGGAPSTSRCGDSRGEPRTSGNGALDLVTVTIARRTAGLTVRFELAGRPAGGLQGMAVAQSWQALFARGDSLTHVLTVEQLGTVWTSEFIDFTDGSNDRRSILDPPSGTVIEVDIPAENLDGLPAPFTWWATAAADQLGDTCPDAALAAELEVDLPPENARARFPG